MDSMREATTEVKEEMTEKEMDEVTTVFRSFETGLREATILPKVCCKMQKLHSLPWGFDEQILFVCNLNLES